MPSGSLLAAPFPTGRTKDFGRQSFKPRQSRWARLPPAITQACVMAALVMSTFALSFASGIASRFYYIGVSLVVAIYYLRKSPWLYITMTLWCWTLTAQVRRLTEYHSGFDPKNFILGTPDLVCLLMLWSIITNREILKLKESLIGLFLVIPIFFGVAVSFTQGNIIGGIAGSADWIAPVLYYFFVIGNWRTAREADSTLRDFFIVNALVVCIYGIYQFVTAPPWDMQWMIASGLGGSMGSPFPFELRMFSVLSVPGILASWLSVLMMLFLHYKSKLNPIMLPLFAILILMTYSRSVAGATVMCLVLAGLMGRKGIMKLMVIGGIALLMGVSAVSIAVPDVGAMIEKRVTSVNDLQDDTSAYERSRIWAESPQFINDHPLGVGIGSIGRGAVAQDNTDFQVIDFGPLAIYLSLGWVGGSFYLLGMILVLIQGWMAARSTRSTAAIAFTCAAASQVALLPFANVLGIPGLCVWFCGGYAAALGIEAQATRQVLTRPIDRFETKRAPRQLGV